MRILHIDNFIFVGSNLGDLWLGCMHIAYFELVCFLMGLWFTKSIHRVCGSQFTFSSTVCLFYFIQFQDREKDFEHKNHLALLVLSQIIVADMVDRSSIRRRKSIAMDNDSGQSSSSTAAVVIGSQIVCESVRHSAILRAASFRCILDSLQFALLDTRASAQSSTTLSSVPVPTRAY
ncbi:hypothetical protein HanIR_Chr16g0841371 [Helianthus annuus]|nr:hypothetical protein HanIR_Chr16g0841371 [Helianthus annuus]